MRSLKICFLLSVCFLFSAPVDAFNLSDKKEVRRYFDTHKEYDFMVLEGIREPVVFSFEKKEIALLPLEISVEGRRYIPHQPKFFLVFTKKNGAWSPAGRPIKKHKIQSLFGRNAKYALFEAGY